VRLAWNLTIIGLGSVATLRDELVSTREDHVDLQLGFNHTFVTWGSSLVWKHVQQEEISGDTCRRGFISTRI